VDAFGMLCTLNSIQGYNNARNKEQSKWIYVWNGMFNLSKTSLYKEIHTKKKKKNPKEKSTKRKKPSVNVWNETSWVRVKISPQKGFWNLARKLEWEKLGFSISHTMNHHLVWRVMTSSMKLNFCNMPMTQKANEKSFKGYPFMPLL
jgi:hypothetical protein